MREGYLVAVDSADKVYPVRKILARNEQMDAAILRLDGAMLVPLALNDDVAPGDLAYCFSDPLGLNGYFSQGIVSRFHWHHAKKGTPGSLEELSYLRMNVSTEWAPGSSGAAILDACGNAIGHVASIAPMTEKPRPAQPERRLAPAQNPPGGATPSSPSPSANDEKSEPSPGAQSHPDRFNGSVLMTLHSATPARGVMALIREINQKCSPNSR